MSTGQRYVDIYLKKFLSQNEMRVNFLEYLLAQSRANLALIYPEEGVFFGGEMAGDGPNKFLLNTPMAATDGLGHILKLDPGYSSTQFENGVGIPYYVGLRYNELPREVEVNVRTGAFFYRLNEEQVGEKGAPNSVVDNGTTLTMIVDNVTEPGVNCSGRLVTIYKKVAAGTADAFYSGVVTWDGVNNKVDTTHIFGQTAGLVSTLASDYVVFVHGPTVKKNTNLANIPDYVFMGIVTGAGTGNTPSVFNQTGVNNVAPSTNLTIVQDILKSFITGGGLVSWNLTAQELSWNAAIQVMVPNRPYNFSIAATTITGIADGDVLYMTWDNVGGNKVLTKVANGSVPNDVNAYPIAMRVGNDIYFADGALELKGDSTITQGTIDGVTKDLLDFIGALSESDSDPNYTSTLVISQGISLVAAISLLDAGIGGLLTSNPQEEEFLVGVGGQSIFTTSVINWGLDNAIPDIAVYVNGHKAYQSPTGALDKDFKKNTNNVIQFAYTIPEDAIVVIRKERSGAPNPGGGGSAVAVEDEGVQQTAQVTKFNFVGSGVTATEVSAGVVQVTVPGAGAGAVNLGKLVKNETGATIPAKSALAYADDGTVELADANVTSLSDFAGVNDAAIPDGEYGFVTKLGNSAGALSSLGALPGALIYLGEVPGSFSLTPPPGLSDTVMILGRAEPPQGIAQANAVDLWIVPQLVAAP